MSGELTSNKEHATTHCIFFCIFSQVYSHSLKAKTSPMIVLSLFLCFEETFGNRVGLPFVPCADN
jgi:hypothetical protein